MEIARIVIHQKKISSLWHAARVIGQLGQQKTALAVYFLKNIGPNRPLFVYIRPFLNTMTDIGGTKFDYIKE